MKPTAFAKKARASQVAKLNANNLDKLGEMRLKDKIALASNEESVEEAAMVLKDLLTPEEKTDCGPNTRHTSRTMPLKKKRRNTKKLTRSPKEKPTSCGS